MIQVKDLTKIYDDLTVLGIHELEVKKGESFGLVGNNGAGKTTFFRLLLDLIKSDHGAALSKGTNVRQSEHWKSYTGSYLDESFVIGYLTPDEYFQFLGNLHGFTNGRLPHALAKFEGFFNGQILGKKKFIRDLSKGNQAKVGIAAAIVFHPQVLVLDEPFAHLDPTSANRLKNLLQEMKAGREVTMLISSHNLNHITEVCERIVLLERGEIIYDIQTSENTLKELEAYFAV